MTLAEELGLDSVFAGDRLTYAVPRLDGLTSLAAMLPAARRSELVAFCAPGLRGPVATARALAAIDVLSGGRLVVAAGTGSGRADYEALGADWAARDGLLESAVHELRSLLAGRTPLELAPFSARPEAPPPVWLATAPTARGLATAARLGDGWLATSFRVPPALLASSQRTLAELREQVGDSRPLPAGISSLFLHVTPQGATAQRFADRLVALFGAHAAGTPSFGLIGSAAHCSETLAAYGEAGADRLWVWPLGDAQRQLELLAGLRA